MAKDSFDCNEENLNVSFLSILRIKFTQKLHRLQCPSKKIMGPFINCNSVALSKLAEPGMMSNYFKNILRMNGSYYPRELKLFYFHSKIMFVPVPEYLFLLGKH